MERTEGNRPRVEDHLDGIKPIKNVVPPEQLEVLPGGIPETFLLRGIDRLDGTPKIGASPRAYLDKSKNLPPSANQVDLPPFRLVIAIKDAIAIPSHKGGRHLLTIAPDFRRRRQPRRG